MTAPESSNPGEDCVLALRRIRATRAGGFTVGLDELALREGEVVALVGPSGCGKSTLLFGLLGLLPGVSVAGERRVLGRALHPDTDEHRALLAGPVTIALQDAKAALDPLQRIGAQIRAVTGASDDAMAAALASLGLTDPGRIARAWPHELSGGQAQKVFLAIAFLRGPRLLVLDEPTSSLDGASIDELVGHLRSLQQRHGTALLLATHDEALVETLGARVLRHEDGRFVAGAAQNGPLATPSAAPAEDVVLRASGVTKAFGAHRVLAGVDLTLSRAEIVAIVGPSGAGKTTLGRILAGLLPRDAGDVAATGGIQLLWQDAYASLTPGRPIRALLAETVAPGFDAEAEARALGLAPSHLAATADRLSGGERRRVALLRALSVQPAILVLDEPTASLDRAAAVAVLEQLVAVRDRRGVACVWITHDATLAAAYAHRILRLEDGRLEPVQA